MSFREFIGKEKRSLSTFATTAYRDRKFLLSAVGAATVFGFAAKFGLDTLNHHMTELARHDRELVDAISMVTNSDRSALVTVEGVVGIKLQRGDPDDLQAFTKGATDEGVKALLNSNHFVTKIRKDSTGAIVSTIFVPTKDGFVPLNCYIDPAKNPDLSEKSDDELKEQLNPAHKKLATSLLASLDQKIAAGQTR